MELIKSYFWLVDSSKLIFSNSLQTFWTAIAAVGTMLAVFAALKPLRDRALISKSMFDNAIQVDVSPDGVFRIFNIFEQPILVLEISQILIKGSDLEYGELVSRSNLLTFLEKAKEKTKTGKGWSKQIEKCKQLAPGLSFILAASLTHLPEAMEGEKIWIVGTRIKRGDGKGNNVRSLSFCHRFSVSLEPRNRWVEVL